MTRRSIVSVEMRLATDEDKHLKTYDHTKLSAINTCPTWGIIRYSLSKTMPGAGRAMALEAGGAMHQAFAAIRVWQLGVTQGLRDHAMAAALRIFGKDCTADLYGTQRPENADIANLRNFALQALYNSGYIDDPNDKRRTMSNMEATLIAYVDQWDLQRFPVWIENVNKPTSTIGIEMPLDIVLTFHYSDGTTRQLRYIGRMDGIHTDPRRNLAVIVHENKTAGRLDDAWRMSFHMSHQVTGYCAGGSVITRSGCGSGLVLGAQIPLPKQYSSGIVTERVPRGPHMFDKWFRWIDHTVDIEEQYLPDPIHAPKLTHSCNRYFRPCAFIPLCTDDEEGMRATLEQMISEEWNPLHEKAGDD